MRSQRKASSALARPSRVFSLMLESKNSSLEVLWMPWLKLQAMRPSRMESTTCELSPMSTRFLEMTRMQLSLKCSPEPSHATRSALESQREQTKESATATDRSRRESHKRRRHSQLQDPLPKNAPSLQAAPSPKDLSEDITGEVATV